MRRILRVIVSGRARQRSFPTCGIDAIVNGWGAGTRRGLRIGRNSGRGTRRLFTFQVEASEVEPVGTVKRVSRGNFRNWRLHNRDHGPWTIIQHQPAISGFGVRRRGFLYLIPTVSKFCARLVPPRMSRCKKLPTLSKSHTYPIVGFRHGNPGALTPCHTTIAIQGGTRARIQIIECITTPIVIISEVN